MSCQFFASNECLALGNHCSNVVRASSSIDPSFDFQKKINVRSMDCTAIPIEREPPTPLTFAIQPGQAIEVHRLLQVQEHKTLVCQGVDSFNIDCSQQFVVITLICQHQTKKSTSDFEITKPEVHRFLKSSNLKYIDY